MLGSTTTAGSETAQMLYLHLGKNLTNRLDKDLQT